MSNCFHCYSLTLDRKTTICKLGTSFLIIYPNNHYTILELLICVSFKPMKLCNTEIKIETVQVKVLFEVIHSLVVTTTFLK